MRNDCLPRERHTPAWSWAGFVSLPENRRACEAVQELGDRFLVDEPSPPLLLHGAPGTGKTHLVRALVAEVIQRRSDLSTEVVSALDLVFNQGVQQEPAWNSDLLVVEDLQFLPAPSVTLLTELWDERLSNGAALVCTSAKGPQDLPMSARLAARLTGGLVIGLSALGAASRRLLLQAKADQWEIAAPPAVLDWVAERCPGNGRTLEGALRQLETLSRAGQRLDLPTLKRLWDNQDEPGTLERIAQRVGEHYQLGAQQLLSRQRDRRSVLPRQVGMYVARLAGCSLAEIGRFFGGRDHTTVLHAYRKIEAASTDDLALASTIRELASGLV